MLLKNLPWTAEWLARGGYAGHLVRDLSNTHVMIVGGGTLLATGLTWYALPRIVQRPLASNGMAHFAFWLTAAGLTVFYVALVGDGIAMTQARAARLGVPGREGASRQVVQGAGRHRRGRHGARLLVLRRERPPHGVPGAARARSEAARAPLEVPRDGRRSH